MPKDIHDSWGNEVAYRIIRRAVLAGRVVNAYVLKGPKGAPLDMVAWAFAESILCDAPTQEGRPCGVCRSCRYLAGDGHPDLIQVEREGLSIKIRKSHEILKEALQKPFYANRKVFIVKDAEDLTVEASNALLKILEEPPPYVTFLLTTKNPSAIPDTVLSRCQVIPVRAMSEAALSSVLAEDGVPQDMAVAIASFSGANADRAARLVGYGPDALTKGRTALQEILSAPSVEIGPRYAKMDASLRLAAVDDLEMELVSRLRATDGDPSRLVSALGSVMKAKERLASNVNPLLVFLVLFIELGKALKRVG